MEGRKDCGITLRTLAKSVRSKRSQIPQLIKTERFKNFSIGYVLSIN